MRVCVLDFVLTTVDCLTEMNWHFMKLRKEKTNQENRMKRLLVELDAGASDLNGVLVMFHVNCSFRYFVF